jgi:tRNA(His) 5'-end guanylyltransferase
MMNWKTYFPDTSLRRTIPSFDARIILYPGIREVRDYFSWRQADSVLHLSRERGRRLTTPISPR